MFTSEDILLLKTLTAPDPIIDDIDRQIDHIEKSADRKRIRDNYETLSFITRELPESKINRIIGSGRFHVVYSIQFKGIEFVLKSSMSVDIENEISILEKLKHSTYSVNMVVSNPGLRNILMVPFHNSLPLDKVKNRDIRFVGTVVLNLVRGLQEMHKKKVFHRDISPKSILVTADGMIQYINFDLSINSEKYYKGDAYFSKYSDPVMMRYFSGTVRTYRLNDYWMIGVVIYELTGFVFPFKAFTMSFSEYCSKFETFIEKEGVTNYIYSLCRICNYNFDLFNLLTMNLELRKLVLK